MFDKFWQSYGPCHSEFLHILACLFNSSNTNAWILKTWEEYCTTSLEVHVGKEFMFTNIAGVKALEMFALQCCCLYEISP